MLMHPVRLIFSALLFGDLEAKPIKCLLLIGNHTGKSIFELGTLLKAIVSTSIHN